ncbi:prephenate dehydrogenase [Permianibacter sp. IMCC34836]|uniref:prephenate dehydrogenase n=1 Tax=Permianibacter fluminis TaxID=2738515 RepID=UPI001557AF2E|nr:prephenate dehydrogenase [Permianibacter fluminis]NQD35883.1 prephenate dehydrogenase [Permianibacter fluminis]
MNRTPRLPDAVSACTVGIVGAAGAYGRWLTAFFTDVMQCPVLGQDPQWPDGPSPEQLLAEADVLVFAAPIRQTPAIIADYVQRAGARSRAQLWLDITSIKTPAMQAMLTSDAEVVGLHPMCAAPKTRTLRGRVLVVCEGRLQRWRPWFEALLRGFDAQTVQTTAAEHDRIMALVQGLVHASHLAQANVIGAQPDALQTLAALLPYRSPSFALDTAVIARLLTGNSAIYQDIQFLNPHVPEVLDALASTLQQMAALVRRGDENAQQAWHRQYWRQPLQTLGADALENGNACFEQLAYLLADLDEPNVVVMHLPRDEPGQLRALLAAFADAEVNLQSLHSSRDLQGRVHFRLGLDRAVGDARVQHAVAQLQASGTAIRVF